MDGNKEIVIMENIITEMCNVKKDWANIVVNRILDAIEKENEEV